MKRQLLDSNALILIWSVIKENFAKKEELHSHENKTELDKIQFGNVEAWNNMVATGIPTFPNQSVLDAISTNEEGVLTYNGQPIGIKMDNESVLLKIGELEGKLTFNEDEIITSVTLEERIDATETKLTEDIEAVQTSFTTKLANVYNKSEIDAKMTSALIYKGTVESFSALPSGAKVGDVYNIIQAGDNNKAGDNAVWNGEEWDVLSGTIDTTALLSDEDIITNEEIQAILI